jgi:hypothetical protein
VTTVSNVPVPPKNVTPQSHVSPQGNDYSRPSAGGNAAGQDVSGRPVDAPPGVIPPASVYHPNLAGNAPDNPITNPGVIK